MSPDLKDVLIAAIPSIIPTVVVGFGILVNKNDITRVSSEIASLRTELHGDIVRVDTRLSDAVVMLINIGNELDKRVSRLDDKG